MQSAAEDQSCWVSEDLKTGCAVVASEICCAGTHRCLMLPILSLLSEAKGGAESFDAPTDVTYCSAFLMGTLIGTAARDRMNCNNSK
jgi:hypothetical protein